MFCTNCGAKLDEGQRFCSNCGTPVRSFTPEQAEPVPAPAQEPPRFAEVRPPVQPVDMKPQKPKKKAWGWVIGILAVILVAVAAAAALRWTSVSAYAGNFVAKTFSDPEDYYRRVERSNIRLVLDAVEESGQEELTRAAGEIGYMEEKLQLSLNTAALGDEILDLIEDDIGMDVSWFRNVGMYVSVGMEDSLAGGTITAFLNDKDIIDADYVLDMDGQNFCFAVPRLSDKYVGIDMSEYDAVQSGNSQELTALLRDRELLTALVERYTELVVKDLTRVEKGTQELSAGDLSAKYTALTVTADGRTLLKIAKNVLNEAENDAELQKLVLAAIRSQGMSEAEADEFYSEEILGWIDRTLEELEKTDASEITQEIRMTVYVDGLGVICGRDIFVLEDGELNAAFRCALLRKGLDYGLFAESFTRDEWGKYREENTYTLSGGGKLSLAGELSGEFTLHIKTNSSWDGEEETTDMTACTYLANAAFGDKGGSFSLSIKPTQEFFDLELEDAESMPESVRELIRSLSAVISGEFRGTRGSMALTVMTGGDELLDMSVDAYPVEAFDFSVPSDTVDVETWAYSMDFGKLQGILRDLMDAGVPASLFGSLGGLM